MVFEVANAAQSFPEKVLAHRGVIYLLTGTMSLIFALVVLSLVRRERTLRDEKWVRPFAYTFLILAAGAIIRAATRMHDTNWFTDFAYDDEIFKAAEYVRTFFSGLTNFLFLYAGLWLGDIEEDYRTELLGKVKFLRSSRLKQNGAQILTLLVFLVAAGLSNIRDANNHVLWWASLPDAFLSAGVLFFVGRTLYENIGVRRDKLMARIALYSAVLYSLNELFRGLIPFLAKNYSTSLPALQLTFTLIAIVLKCGLFFSGYGLMLLISGSTTGVRALFNSITSGKSEYLESHGVVQSICQALGASRVELYILLPGTKSHEVAWYRYPPHRDKVGKEITGPLIEPFDPARTYGHVISTGRKLTYRLTNRPDKAPEELLDKFSAQSSILAVPILFHKAVIGCLKVVIDIGRVNEADFKNTERFATILSPTAQVYRQVEALNQLSQRLAQYQIEQPEYNLETDIKRIIQIIHDILAPVATGIIINSGFGMYSSKSIQPGYEKIVGDRLFVASSEETVVAGGKEITYLPRDLKIGYKTLEERKVAGKDDSTGTQSFGKLILVTEDSAQNQPTLATGFFYNQAVSNLVTDSLLDFVRGYLSQVTNRLSVKLSKIDQPNLSEWIRDINDAAKEAGLLWAAASQADREGLLDPEQQGQLIGSLDRKWALKDGGLWLCEVEGAREGATHVIKVTLAETGETLWLGVRQPGFGVELEYVSPWYAFVRILAGVADSALRRMTAEQQWEKMEKEVSEFHGLATVAITTGTVVHEIANQVQEILWPVTMLEDAIRRKTLAGNTVHEEAIFSLRHSATQIEELTRVFAGFIKPDSRRPCSLTEAVHYAEGLLHESINRLHINLVVQVSPFFSLDVPFYVAAFALVNLVTNAKNALKKVASAQREIRITAEDLGDSIRCRVSDNGPGIPPKLVKQIFESGSKTNGAGSGLGLYLSARSIGENRGRLELTHPGPDPNTTFTIYFPKPREG